LSYAFVKRIADVHFVSTRSSGSSLLDIKAELLFLSMVQVSKIPLYLAVGPSYEVYTNSEVTRDLFAYTFLEPGENDGSNAWPSEAWWMKPKGESTSGILLKVKGDGSERGFCPWPTEILLYAAVLEGEEGLPTPPASSSPTPLEQVDPESRNDPIPVLKVFALPLCSDIIRRARAASGLSSPPPEKVASGKSAYFLPDAPAEEKLNSKRQRLSSRFEDATKQRRRAKDRGGEGVAKAMANLDMLAPPHGLPKSSANEEVPSIAVVFPKKRVGLSRVASMPSLADFDSTRQASRSGSFAPTKRSSLHRVESAISPSEGTVSLDADTHITHQNRAALAKVVMAGMRLHGVQQRKAPGKDSDSRKLSRTVSMAGSEASLEGEDDYKLIYHQTFKAAAFTFREHFSARGVSQDAMRDVVDKLLSLFCTDPLAKDGYDEMFLLATQGLVTESSNGFDVPSSSAPPTMLAAGSSAPHSKKRKLADSGEGVVE